MLIEMTHAHEDIHEDRLEVQSGGALDPGSEAGKSRTGLWELVRASPWKIWGKGIKFYILVIWGPRVNNSTLTT